MQPSGTVIGDSVTAGVDDDETAERWPQILPRRHDVVVTDVSYIGETAASALRRLQNHEINSPLVFVEIGGNGLPGGVPSSVQFSLGPGSVTGTCSSAGRAGGDV